MIPIGGDGSAAAGTLGPTVIVLEDAYDAGPFAAGVLFHLDEYRKALRECGACRILRVEGKHFAVFASDVAPDASVVFNLDLEHVDLLVAA
jgi:hypothetical protein